MRDMGTPHQRMQELCDCFAETDPLGEMALLGRDADKDEAALKWLALAILHGIDRGAREDFPRKGGRRQGKGGGGVQGQRSCPLPGAEIGERIIRAARQISHLEDADDKGETPWPIGIRDSSIEIRVKVKRKDGGEKITLEFEP